MWITKYAPQTVQEPQWPRVVLFLFHVGFVTASPLCETSPFILRAEVSVIENKIAFFRFETCLCLSKTHLQDLEICLVASNGLSRDLNVCNKPKLTQKKNTENEAQTLHLWLYLLWYCFIVEEQYCAVKKITPLGLFYLFLLTAMSTIVFPGAIRRDVAICVSYCILVGGGRNIHILYLSKKYFSVNSVKLAGRTFAYICVLCAQIKIHLDDWKACC